MREVTGGVNVQSASGDIEVDVVRGPINVNSASGDVTIREAYDDVSTNTVSGDQEHAAVCAAAWRPTRSPATCTSACGGAQRFFSTATP